MLGFSFRALVSEFLSARVKKGSTRLLLVDLSWHKARAGVLWLCENAEQS